jgi:hypothetical protein
MMEHGDFLLAEHFHPLKEILDGCKFNIKKMKSKQ